MIGILYYAEIAFAAIRHRWLTWRLDGSIERGEHAEVRRLTILLSEDLK